MRGGLFPSVFASVTLWLGSAAAPLRAEGPQGSQLMFFETRIRPVLVTRCYECHSAESGLSRGGLRLDTRDGPLQGGKRGPAIVAGKPDESLLVVAIAHTDPDLKMPRKGDRLSSDQVADFRKWIAMGAPDPRDTAQLSQKTKPILLESKPHWSFKPVVTPVPPAVRRTDWVVNPIDRFVLAKMEAVGVQPNPSADKRTLLRRVTYDLTGLPPSFKETREFVEDENEDAFAKVVDRLLASHRYGERWARHWMDIARYADTKGDVRRQQEDPRYPHAWTYRDYLIESFNSDKPYDLFVKEQLAADLLIRRDAPDKTSLAALGFLALGDHFNGQIHDVINDRIDVVTRGLLGLTVACARCHDHKFDPIPTRDYYSLHGIFASSYEPAEAPLLSPPPETQGFTNYLKRRLELTSQLKDWDDELRAFRRDPKARTDQMKRQQLVRKGQQIRNQLALLEMNDPNAPPRAHVLLDADWPKDSPVQIRGDSAQRGAVVPRRFLECLTVGERKQFRHGSGRLDLANAIADPRNPLTARVFVNRVWQNYFGEGIVATPDDFGHTSAPPSHPELLNWLASEFMEGGWSIKALHRTIVLSNTYRQSCESNTRSAQIDPSNKLLWRASLKRIDFESLRDSLLAISGALIEHNGGRPVDLTSSSGANRRTLYGYLDRNRIPEILYQFDFPNPDTLAGRRFETIVPQQVLFMMNNAMVLEAARAIARSPQFTLLSQPVDRIQYLYDKVFQRPASEEELRLGVDFVAQGQKRASTSSLQSGEATLSSAKAQPVAPEIGEAPGPTRGEFLRRRRSERPGNREPQRSPMNAWETYIHALLQSNEISYLN